MSTNDNQQWHRDCPSVMVSEYPLPIFTRFLLCSLSETNLNPHSAVLKDPLCYNHSIFASLPQVVSFLQIFPLKICMDFSAIACMLHDLSISLVSSPQLWSRVLMDLEVFSANQKFLRFYGAQSFINMFTRARHWCLWIQSRSLQLIFTSK